MAKIKYFYNPNKLDFEKVRTSITAVILRVFGFLSASVVAGAIMVLALYTFIDSPKEKILRRQNEVLNNRLRKLEHKVGDLMANVNELKDKDVSIYRAIFEAEPPQKSKSKINEFQIEDDEFSSALLQRVILKVNELQSEIASQQQSFVELEKMAKNKTEYLASIPAIQPVANKDLRRIASGFGYRLHPIYKTYKFHSGIDFTAPRRTPVYATGNGRIEASKYELRGYGNHVIINHGFGYESLYGHLSSIEVYNGQQVKRGELIGYVGNTGTSTAPHLHYEVIKNRNKVNPINYFFNDVTESDYEAIRDIANKPSQSFD